MEVLYGGFRRTFSKLMGAKDLQSILKQLLLPVLDLIDMTINVLR